jgi:hypothetical protein
VDDPPTFYVALHGLSESEARRVLAALAGGGDEPMTLIPNLPTPEGRALGEHLARFVRVEVEELQAAGRSVPEMCGTCAFLEGSDPNGCVPTVMDALKCVMEGGRFLCHERDGACAGWAILRAAEPAAEPVEMPWMYSDEYKEPGP